MVDENTLKEILGPEEYEAYQTFREAREKKLKQAKAREIASAMVSEGGKFGDDYGRLEGQLNALWEKASAEARKQVGLVEEG